MEKMLYREFQECRLCPRYCKVDRTRGETGQCGSDAGLRIGSICMHRGEEPVVSGKKGICNVFFSSCSLQCLYCQNYQISNRKPLSHSSYYTIRAAVDEIVSCLEQGAEAVGFVTPTHLSPWVRAMVEELHRRGHEPVIVYNTSGYENVEVLKGLEGLVDVYLPDFKYLDPGLASMYSGARDYPEVIKAAMLEMYRQKGSSVILSEGGQVLKGLIVRHLVLPGGIQDSKEILTWIAENLSASVSISLMSQYGPTPLVSDHPVLSRSLTVAEYDEVVTHLEALGFENGWVQEMSSNAHYKPDFNLDHPFD